VPMLGMHFSSTNYRIRFCLF